GGAVRVTTGPHLMRPRRFCTRPTLVHGAEMAESRGRTSGCVARGPRSPRRNCATTFLTLRSKFPLKAIGKRMIARLASRKPRCHEALEGYVAAVGIICPRSNRQKAGAQFRRGNRGPVVLLNS